MNPSNMTTLNSEEYFSERLVAQIKWYSKKAGANKLLSNWSKIMALVMGALVTLVSQLDFNPVAKSIILGALGLFVTVVAGLSSILGFQEKWIAYRRTSEALKRESFLFKTKTGYYDCDDPIKVLVPKVEQLLTDENLEWKDNIGKE
jgi:hypothetical protein